MPLTDDDVGSGDIQDVGENYFQQIKNKATKLGYADGIADGRDSVFQKGFDLGYKDGLRTSFEIDKFRNFFKNLNMDKLENDHHSKCMKDEKDEFEKLQIQESKSAEHFQYIKYKEESLDYVSERQHEYVNEIIEKCVQKMPNASALLKTQDSTSCI